MKSTRRYVVLHHMGIAEPHFDLLFEWEPESLLTAFRCPRWPVEVGDTLEELPDHRRLYLDYEGPISGGRGTVVRIEAGTIDAAELLADPPTLAVEMLADGAGTSEVTLIHGYVSGSERHTRWTVSTASRP